MRSIVLFRFFLAKQFYFIIPDGTPLIHTDEDKTDIILDLLL